MQTPRGTRDLFGEELASIRHVMDVMRKMFETYGYEEVETPIFEHLDLFTKKSGSSIVRQLYTFRDKSGRELALRPELTAPVVRLYIQRLRSSPKPLKLFYFGPCFRYEEPQAKRWRQFTQAGVEIIGSSRPEADAEVVALSCDIMRALGIGFRVRVGNVRILREVLSSAGIKNERQDPVLRAIDSGDEKRVEQELRAAGGNEDNVKEVLAISKIRGGTKAIERAGEIVESPGGRAALDYLVSVIERLRDFKVEELEVDLGIARGLDYYTGFVFEIYSGGVQLAGGGRYDDLVETLGGDPTPAVGAGFGIERIAGELGDTPARAPAPVVVAPAAEDCLPEALRIATMLRRNGIRATPELGGRKLGKALAYAGSIGSELVVIVGRKEIERGEATLRDMRTGEQRSVRIEELPEEISRHQKR